MSQKTSRGLYAIPGGKELRDPQRADGYVCREELYHNGELVWCKIWTWVSGSVPLAKYTKFHEMLERKLHPSPEPLIGNTPIITKEGTRAELSVLFHGPMSKRCLSAKVGIFKSCLKTTGIIQNPLDCSLRRVK